MLLDTATSSATSARKAACLAMLADTHAILSKEGVTPSALHEIKLALVALALKSELFPMDDFAMPETQSRLHPLEVEDDDGLGLYLIIAYPEKEALPHDHGIWCVNAAVSGRERHDLWRRVDDGAEPGHAKLEKIGEVMVEPGNGFAMADHGIHSTEVVGSEPAVILVLYGYRLDRFPSIVWYNPEFSASRPTRSMRGAGAA